MTRPSARSPRPPRRAARQDTPKAPCPRLTGAERRAGRRPAWPAGLVVPLLVPLLGALAATLGACAEDLQPRDDDDGIIGGGDGKVVTARNDDGSYTTVIDATALDAWPALDLDLGVESVAPDDSWDLAAQRFHFRLHEGAAGAGGSTVMALGDVPLAAVEQAGGGEWLVDLPDGDDENTTPDYAFEQGEGWYDYDSASHVLTPFPTTWLLRTGEGALRALRIESYYDSAGTAAVLRLRWRLVRGTALSARRSPTTNLGSTEPPR